MCVCGGGGGGEGAEHTYDANYQRVICLGYTMLVSGNLLCALDIYIPNLTHLKSILRPRDHYLYHPLMSTQFIRKTEERNDRNYMKTSLNVQINQCVYLVLISRRLALLVPKCYVDKSVN